ncbi:MAG: ABC transporter substrate-binding protein, partial [Desulfobacteraceae bacterium]|nr:ABC transporter substrate-binding protein [Desulfobacteraceae bacterium]
KIIPYISVLEGIIDNLDKKKYKIDVFYLPGFEKEDHSKLKEKIVEKTFRICVGIGDEAAAFTWSLDAETSVQKMYTAVLAPDKIIRNDTDLCGISLRIPVDKQLQEIGRALPGIKQIGLIFDPRYNNWFYGQAIQASQANELEIVPLTVNSKNQIPKVLKEHMNKVDCIWMIPDKTIVSKAIIQYVIKLSLLHKKGVVGYNSFFTRSGAVFSFEFDYKKLGAQTAHKIIKVIENGICNEESPLFNRIVNQKTAEKIGLEIIP